MDGQGTKCRRQIEENYNRLSRVHERYRRQTTDRPTDRHTNDRQTDEFFQSYDHKMYCRVFYESQCIIICAAWMTACDLRKSFIFGYDS